MATEEKSASRQRAGLVEGTFRVSVNLSGCVSVKQTDWPISTKSKKHCRNEQA